MIIECPHCGKQLKAGERLMQSVQALPEGGKIRVKCTQCSTPIDVDASMLGGVKKSAVKSKVKPPAAPDLSWLTSSAATVDERAEELPLVMVLARDTGTFGDIATAFESMGYRVETANSGEDAIEKMQFVVYSAVVLHADFEDGPIETSQVHLYIRDMGMTKRRQMLYILVGSHFQTMYDLEALSYSANMVVNDKELSYFSVLLHKIVLEHESLFGPILDELDVFGK